VAQFQAGSPQLLPRDGVPLKWVAQDLRSANFHVHNNGEPVRQGKMVLLLSLRVSAVITHRWGATKVGSTGPQECQFPYSQ